MSPVNSVFSTLYNKLFVSNLKPVKEETPNLSLEPEWSSYAQAQIAQNSQAAQEKTS